MVIQKVPGYGLGSVQKEGSFPTLPGFNRLIDLNTNFVRKCACERVCASLWFCLFIYNLTNYLICSAKVYILPIQLFEGIKSPTRLSPCTREIK